MIFGDDLGDQRLEAGVETVFAGVERAVALHHPAHVAGRGSRRVARGDGVRGIASSRSIVSIAPVSSLRSLIRQRPQHRGDVVLGRAFEPGERLAALRGQAQLNLPAVAGSGLRAIRPLLVEVLHDAAEIAGVEPERDADLLGRLLATMGQLVEHARLAQRERALQELLVEHAELPGVEAVEGANRLDLVVSDLFGRSGAGWRRAG